MVLKLLIAVKIWIDKPSISSGLQLLISSNFQTFHFAVLSLWLRYYVSRKNVVPDDLLVVCVVSPGYASVPLN